MDASHFDRLVKELSATGTRRGLLGLLAAIPLWGGPAALLIDDDAASKGRRKGRKKRSVGGENHKHDHRRRKHKPHHGRHKHKKKHKHKKHCTPEAKTTTCEGKCGPVQNNCNLQKTVDCGPCACDPPCDVCERCTSDTTCEPCEPCCDEVCCAQANAICHADSGECCVPHSTAQTCDGECGDVVNDCGVTVGCGPCTCGGGCPECKVCDEETDDCVPDSNKEGEACGEGGQVCQSDGDCECDATSCPACTTCGQGGRCTGCSGCCEGEICVAECGACQVCDGEGQCSSCPDCCDGSVCVETCPACETCDGQGQCVSCANLDLICCSGGCVDGVCCDDVECLEAGAPDCVGHQCGCATNGDMACATGEICCNDGCAAFDTDPGHCGSCGTTCSGSTPVCWNGECVCGDICAGDDCQFTTVQAAIAAANSGDTIRICAGTYTRNGTSAVAVINGKNLTLIGAGAGNTILDGGDVATTNPVFACGNTSTGVQHLTVTGANGRAGIVANPDATLTLTGVIVTGNVSSSIVGGGIDNRGDLTLNAGTSVTANTAGSAGGIFNFGGKVTLSEGSSVTGNTCEGSGGGIDNHQGEVILQGGSSVSGNSAGEGGGIDNYEGEVTLQSGSSVSGNSAGSQGGGGIYNQDGTVTLNVDSEICGNSLPDCVGFDDGGICQDTCSG